MNDEMINTTIEILGRPYPIRCPASELNSLQEAAAFLNQEMVKVRDSGKVANFERIVVITALNMAHEFLRRDNQRSNVLHKVSQRIAQLQNKLDTAINKKLQTEFVYTTETE